ncbi:MAG: prepilin-type N-terminal cleavage/methylation domain-containing protein [Bacilli bacterium]
MNKKGFTLVELLAVIIILGLIALIVTPILFDTIDESKDELYNTQIKMIEDSAKQNVYDERFILDLIDSGEQTSYKITLEDLVNKGYLESIPLNPKSNEKFDGNACVIISKDSYNNYKFIFDEDCEVVLTENVPVLAEGMTPIKWSASGNVVETTTTYS